MSNNQQSPESWHAPAGSQASGDQPYPPSPGQPYPPSPGQQYPGTPPYPEQQQHPGIPPYPEQQEYPRPVRQTGKRVISMVLLVIGYFLGSLVLLQLPMSLLRLFANAQTADPGYVLGGIIGSLIFPCAFAALVISMHRWRARIRRDEVLKY